MPSSDVVRHHFDLSHFDHSLDDLRFHIGLQQFPVSRHDGESLTEAARRNAVIGMMGAEQRISRITHYADAPASAFPPRRIRTLKVSYDNGDKRFRLRPMAWVATWIPPGFRHKARTKALRGAKTAHAAKLHDLGLAPVAAVRHADLMADADLIGTPVDTAIHLVMKHPQLGTTFAPSATCIENHVDTGGNRTALIQLAVHIKQNPTTWQTIEVPVDPGTNKPYVFEYPLGPNKVGDPVEQYALGDDTVAAMGAAMIAPLNSTSDDPQLRNQSWSVAHGRPAIHGGANRAARRALRREAAVGGVDWSLSMADLPERWGLSIDSDSISFDGSTLSIDVTNSIQRTVCAYVEFLDPSGDAIVPPNWQSRLVVDLSGLETETTKYLAPIPPQIVLMGMPLSDSTATLSFPWPEAASSARLTFGSMGGSNWSSPISVPGAVLTGIFNFGFPALFLSAGVFSANGSWFADMLKGPEGMIVIGLGAVIVTGLIVGGIEFGDAPAVLTTFSGIVGGMLAKAALASAMAGISGDISADEAAEGVPIVGQVLRALAAIGYAIQLAEATVEVFRAPALMTVDINRSFTVTVGVNPDPRHGLPGKPATAVWPALGDNYEVTVQYRGGVSRVLSGTMPASESGTPLALTFDTMPAGGSLQVMVAIKSSDGWLCGTWTSDWQDALPDDGDVLAINGSITEQLAPLTSATTYGFNQSIVYSPTGGPKGTGGHAWVSDVAPTATVEDLGSGADVGLGQLVGMTVLEKTYSVGYVWKGLPLNPDAGSSGAPASAQAYCYQGLSLIGDPDNQLMIPNSVTAEQSGVFYEKFGAVPTAGGPPPYNYLIDPSSGTLNLTAIDLSGPLNGSLPGALTLQPPAPTWGSFPLLKTLDDAVVHPGGGVVGISSASNKLLILTVPKAGAATATGSAVAQYCSGIGTRQGLVSNPVALDICPDGRILVLEQGNARVQAFDALANPVPSFDGSLLFTADGSGITASLDDETLPPALQALFLSNRINLLFSLPASTAGDFAAGTASAALCDAFQDESTILSTTAIVAAATAAGQWTIVDPVTKQSYGVVASSSTSGGFDVFHIFGADATVTARVAGSRWTISDPAGALAYDIRIDSGDATKIDVYEFLATFPLAPTADKTTAVCLDIAVEITGFVYVLTHTGNGFVISEFALDIYTAEGKFLSRTGSAAGSATGFVGSKIAVDIWRNLFTLDYQKTVGLSGQSEPTISQWVPTVPAATLPASSSADFVSANVNNVRADLEAAGVALAASFTIETISAAGHWQVIGPPSWDVILSAGTTQPVGGSTATGALQLYVYPLADA